jgi:hypothetical protein
VAHATGLICSQIPVTVHDFDVSLLYDSYIGKVRSQEYVQSVKDGFILKVLKEFEKLKNWS